MVAFNGIVALVIMIGLIPTMTDDLWLTGTYVLIAALSIWFDYQRGDVSIFIIGGAALLVSEYFFISSGVEVFVRHSLFGVMLVWLPVLWGFAFVVIRRCLTVIEGVSWV